MQEGWTLVFAAAEEFKARIADDILKQHGIESLILRKPDSMFPSTGEAELYAPAEKAAEAIEVLRANNIIE